MAELFHAELCPGSLYNSAQVVDIELNVYFLFCNKAIHSSITPYNKVQIGSFSTLLCHCILEKLSPRQAGGDRLLSQVHIRLPDFCLRTSTKRKRLMLPVEWYHFSPKGMT